MGVWTGADGDVISLLSMRLMISGLLSVLEAWIGNSFSSSSSMMLLLLAGGSILLEGWRGGFCGADVSSR